MNDEEERKGPESKQEGNRGRQKRNKENKCGERLFIWWGVITIRQGEASTFVKGVIPKEKENWKDRHKEAEYESMWVER